MAYSQSRAVADPVPLIEQRTVAIDVRVADTVRAADSSQARATQAGTTSVYPHIITDTIAAVERVRPVQGWSVRFSEGVSARDTGPTRRRWTQGVAPPFTVSLVLTEQFGITDRVPTVGIGVTDSVPVLDVPLPIPSSITLEQAPSYLERIRDESTSLPELTEVRGDVIYRGIAMPLSASTFPVIKEEHRLLEDSVKSILLTKIGQRLFVPDYGSSLWAAVFEQNDIVLHALIREAILTALGRWEPRINVEGVECMPEEHYVWVHIVGTIVRLNQIFEMRLQVSRSLISPTLLEAA